MAHLNYESRRGSGKKLKVHFDLPEDEDCPISSHSSSSVASDSSLESVVIDKDDDGIDTLDSKYADNEKQRSRLSADFTYPSPVWSYHSGSVTQSPPVQLMGHPGYDPNRIPMSIFSSRSTSPMEWSVASNESLFSIHIGNNSFSRDHVSTFNKSGELPRTNDLASMSTTLPTVQEGAQDKHVEMERRSVSTDTSEETADLVIENDHKTTETSAATTATVLDNNPEDHSKEAMVPSKETRNYTSISYRSVESDMSAHSFQFPILTVDGGRSSSAKTIESEKQQPEKSSQPPSPETKTAPRHSGINWCYCFPCCSPCFLRVFK